MTDDSSVNSENSDKTGEWTLPDNGNGSMNGSDGNTDTIEPPEPDSSTYPIETPSTKVKSLTVRSAEQVRLTSQGFAGLVSGFIVWLCNIISDLIIAFIPIYLIMWGLATILVFIAPESPGREVTRTQLFVENLLIGGAFLIFLFVCAYIFKLLGAMLSKMKSEEQTPTTEI